jgi:diguanylate cyclase (GGDEF)-like protein/PAS domain S-box-containing protein
MSIHCRLPARQRGGSLIAGLSRTAILFVLLLGLAAATVLMLRDAPPLPMTTGHLTTTNLPGAGADAAPPSPGGAVAVDAPVTPPVGQPPWSMGGTAVLIGPLLVAALICFLRTRAFSRRVSGIRRALWASRRELFASRRAFRTLVQENRSGLLILDADGTVLFANPAVAALLGTSAERLIGMPFGIPITTDQDGDGQTEIAIVRRGGAAGVAAMIVSETRWQDRPAYLVMLHDITERKAEEVQVRRRAFEDALTGLPNRDLFRDRLRQSIGLASREGKGLAVLFMDLDAFKQINDDLGHAVGDALLCAVAQRLRLLVRGSDTIARMGGDEFTGVLYDVPDRPSADRIGEKFLDAFLVPFRLDGHELHVTPSVGISLFPEMGDNPDQLIQLADSAMYAAKRAGGRGWRVYGHGEPVTAQNRSGLEGDLRMALTGDQLTLYYQPQISFTTGTCVGFEALLRWRHPARGLIDPAAFMPLLESTGLIVEVGRWELDEACRQLREWLDNFADPCSLAVNCSLVQFERGDLYAQVAGALARHRIPPQLLVLDLTEGTILARNRRLPRQFERLAALGVKFHLDDFGTGCSALTSIRQLPITGIKIDRRLIAGLGSDLGDDALIGATLSLAHAVGNLVIAEGVESAEQAAALERSGCDLGQGYYFGAPMPPGAVPGWRDRWARQGCTLACTLDLARDLERA